MKYWGVILVGSGLGIFLAFLTGILLLGESSPSSIAGVIIGLALMVVGIYRAGVDYKALKNSAPNQAPQRPAAN